jgi:CelD/BcsL family acetyltransferase involved in cellulose biosynthesis
MNSRHDDPSGHLARGTRASTLNGMALTLAEITAPTQVAAAWQDLEGRSAASFFQSWAWIDNWLATLPEGVHPRLLTVRHGGETVGLGVLAERRRWRRGLIPSNDLFLNETGDPGLDVLTIEFNGLLADRRVKAAVWRASIEFLVESLPGWDALYISGAQTTDVADLRDGLAPNCRLQARIAKRSPSAYVDLEALRRGGDDALGALSRNTGYQVRRAMRRYEARGPLALHAAGSLEEAQAFFSELKRLHQDYWVARGHPGAFANEYFETFHRRLVSRQFDDGGIELLRVSAGAEPVGYLYNFRKDRWFYNYQSGFNYQSDNKLKPGLVCHCLAMRRYFDRGARAYDFLAGDSQYKRSLSNARRDLVWLVLQKDRFRYRVEDVLRRVYRAAKGQGESSPGAS